MLEKFVILQSCQYDYKINIWDALIVDTKLNYTRFFFIDIHSSQLLFKETFTFVSEALFLIIFAYSTNILKLYSQFVEVCFKMSVNLQNDLILLVILYNVF